MCLFRTDLLMHFLSHRLVLSGNLLWQKLHSYFHWDRSRCTQILCLCKSDDVLNALGHAWHR
ncbi:hypothetical protein GEV33_000956 [Tenebrio molitor]|uniref:Uncharacterized protein n=1 Tax=Tenebrio molitor TaxID=7067 RepID=A0A8J6HW71_TENMO|nr:hypothetical protein GEV33_000956 [Tenebrio molitor]